MCSKSAVETAAVNAIAWVHELASYSSISNIPIVTATIKGLQHSLAKPFSRKEPISPDMLQAIVESMSQSPSLSEMRLTSVALVAYAAFLRYAELAKLRCCDVTFLPDCMMLHITCSKIDQFCEGASVTVARTGQPTCPVSMLEKYFAMAGLQHSSQQRLFRGITVSKAGEKLRCSG